MDKDKNYIPPSRASGAGRSTYGRKVVNRRGREEKYDPDRARRELNEKLSSQKRRREDEKRKKRERRRALRIKILLSAAVVIILGAIVLFLTPLLNIRFFNVEGNRIIQSEQIEERLQPLIGENLLTLSEGKVKKQLEDLSYVEELSVSKYLIPPTALITIHECTPSARIELNGYNVIIDPELKILSDSNEFDAEHLPHVDGLNINKYTVGTTLTLADDSDEKLDVLKTCLRVMNNLNMTEKTDYIDLTDITNIRFGYDDRIDALCGTRLDLERKIRMFNVTVNGSSLADNARGTIDLKTSGRAVYIP